MAKRIWLGVAALVAAGIVWGAITMFGWMIDGTHFDRPSADFDRLTTRMEELPGVSVTDVGRWVEAPAFWTPRSHIGLTVDEASLPGLLDAACSAGYAEPVSWSLAVEGEGGTTVSVHGDPTTGCLDVGFDVVGFVGAARSSVPGLDLQPAIWGEDQFAVVALEEHSESITTLLPLVVHADDVRDAAGLDSTRSVEINASTLILVVEPGESDRYAELLSDLVDEHGVTSYWADGGGTPTDGVTKVQVVAPDREHSAIEAAIRSSGLHIAEFPVRFISQR